FLGTRPWIRSYDQGFFDRELRILEPAQAPIGQESTEDRQGHREEHYAIVLNGEDPRVHGGLPPRASPRSRTFMPSRRKVTPATAMRSPGCSPSIISTWLPVA